MTDGSEGTRFRGFEARWSATENDNSGRVHLLVARLGGGRHEALAVAELCHQRGLIGDRWERGKKPSRGRQLTLMDVTVAKLVCGDRPLSSPGDNLLVDLNLSERNLPVGTELTIGAVRLRVSDKPHLGCRIFAERFGEDALAWVNARDHRHRRLRGVNCEILVGGTVRQGDRIDRVEPTP